VESSFHQVEMSVGDRVEGTGVDYDSAHGTPFLDSALEEGHVCLSVLPLVSEDQVAVPFQR
jgi:hypothetical protein